MKCRLPIALICLLLSQGAWARDHLSPDDRAGFRRAVDDYQIFVVPHCAPDVVRAYVAARADRDRAFVRSLRHTGLKADYQKAVTDRATRDSSTVYECFGPPPPPPPPGTVAPPRDPAQADNEHKNALAEHFAGGDRQFATMEQLRDRLISPPRK